MQNLVFSAKLGPTELLVSLNSKEFQWARDLLIYELAMEYLECVLKTPTNRITQFLAIFNRFIKDDLTLLQVIISLVLFEKLWKAVLCLLENFDGCGIFHERASAMRYLADTFDSVIEKEDRLIRIMLETC